MLAFIQTLMGRAVRVLLNIVLCMVVLLGSSAWAQSAGLNRRIPKDAPKAEMVVNGVRILNLNGKDYRLQAGAQIRSEKNRIVLPQSLAGNVRYIVRVKFDTNGDLHKVWMLTEEENAEPAPILK